MRASVLLVVALALVLLTTIVTARTIRYKVVKRKRTKSSKPSKSPSIAKPSSVPGSVGTKSKTTSAPTSNPVAVQSGQNAVFKVIICAILRDEDRYVDEWIQYNKFLGFDLIHVFDNSLNGSAKLAYLPQRYGAFVTVRHFPGDGLQTKAYNQCAKRYNQPNTWAAFIDADEFVVLHQHPSIQALLNATITAPGIRALSLNRIPFGSNGHLAYDPHTPVLRRFTARSDFPDIMVKTIAHLPDVTKIEPHWTRLRPNLIRVDCHGTVMHTGSINRNATEDIAAINHYYTKSYEEFRLKRLRGDAYSAARAQRYTRSYAPVLSTTTIANTTRTDRNTTSTGSLAGSNYHSDGLDHPRIASELLILREFQAWDREANVLYDTRAWEFYSQMKEKMPNFPPAQVE